MRAFFLQNKCVHRIIDFSHKRVFDAQTYTAITFLGREKKSSILYDRVKSHQTPQQFVSNANGSPNSIKELNVKKWRLLKTDEQKNIKIIEIPHLLLKLLPTQEGQFGPSGSIFWP